MSDKIKLHIGSGKRFLPGWLHIDKAKFDHITLHDVEHIPYKDNSVDMIYSSHLINYFTRNETIDLLREWKRVLKSGGKLFLAVPDFSKLVTLYTVGDAELFEILGPLFGEMNCNKKVIHHKTTWNYKELGSLLRNLGFKGIEECDDIHGEADLPEDFDDHSMAYMNGTLISLNMVCTKE